MIIGTPAQSTSEVVVCPEHKNVSKHKSANFILFKWTFLSASSEKMILDPSIPLFAKF